MITDQDMDDLNEMARRATPGPWTANYRSVLAAGGTDTYSGLVLGSIAHCEATTQTDAEGRTWVTSGHALDNAAFIALANPSTILSLIERVKEAERHIKALRAFAETECARAEIDAESASNRCDVAGEVHANGVASANAKILGRIDCPSLLDANK